MDYHHFPQQKGHKCGYPLFSRSIFGTPRPWRSGPSGERTRQLPIAGVPTRTRRLLCGSMCGLISAETHRVIDNKQWIRSVHYILCIIYIYICVCEYIYIYIYIIIYTCVYIYVYICIPCVCKDPIDIRVVAILEMTGSETTSRSSSYLQRSMEPRHSPNSTMASNVLNESSKPVHWKSTEKPNLKMSPTSNSTTSTTPRKPAINSSKVHRCRPIFSASTAHPRSGPSDLVGCLVGFPAFDEANR